MLEVCLYRYHPEIDATPRMETLEVDDRFRRVMVLDVLEHLKRGEPSLAYRRSCREGVCGSDGMNINGKTHLACVTPVSEALNGGDTLILRPLPGMPVIRDLVVDQTQFFRQFEKIRPWLISDQLPSAIERRQNPADREKLDGPFSVFRCRQIANCIWVCPKGLNPMRAIGHIKAMLLAHGS